MSKRYSGKSFKDSIVMKKPKLTFKEKRELKEEKKKKNLIKFYVVIAEIFIFNQIHLILIIKER